jgi:hypothetical protein
MQAEAIVNEVKEKYSEWIEHAGGRSSEIIITVLAQMLSDERKLNEFYKKRLDYVSNAATNRRVV